jgi:hypothetical protein
LKPARQIVCETLSRKTPSQKKADGVTQGVGPENSSPSTAKEKGKKKKKRSWAASLSLEPDLILILNLI